MIPSLEGLPTKAKEAPSPHEVRLAPLDTNPVFHSLRDVSSFIRRRCVSALANHSRILINPLKALLNHNASSW